MTVLRMRMFSGWFQRSVVPFLWAKGLHGKGVHKDIFLFTVGSFCHVKRFTTTSRYSLKEVRKSQKTPEYFALLRLRQKQQQSQDFCAAGFDVLVNQWAKCISAVGGYVEK
jgi:hypothetical protein